MQIGYFGLGKMGYNMVLRLQEKGYDVIACNRSPEPIKKAAEAGVNTALTCGDLAKALKPPRTVWIMVPAAKPVDDVIFGSGNLINLLEPGDTIIEGGNSFYKDSMRRAEEVAKKGINFLDVGVSGGPEGARNGACIMVGCDKKLFEKYEDLFKDLSVENGYAHIGGIGAGHFAKMVHNGIEYGMMQAIGEGFEILKKSSFSLDLEQLADLYNHGSVIESRLVGWLKSAYEIHGDDLKEISGKINQSGEGRWTSETAKELGVPAPIIDGSVKFRTTSQEKPSYTGQVVSALRNQFGGHEVKKDDKDN